MGLISKLFNFSNGSASDATQVNQDLDTLYTLVNGNIDDSNVKAGTINNGIASEAVTPAKSKGLPYASDLFGSTGVVISGLTASKDGTNASQVDVTTGIIYTPQSDGSIRRFSPVATNFSATSASATYYLDFQPDGTWSWTTGHSTQTGYVPICSVTTDASAHVNIVTDARPIAQISISTPDTNLKALLLMGGF